jgi:hypothetical protein
MVGSELDRGTVFEEIGMEEFVLATSEEATCSFPTPDGVNGISCAPRN